MSMRSIVSTSIISLTVAACGGGGGGGDSDSLNTVTAPVENAAQGFYSGADANGNTVGGVVLDTGELYFVYANAKTNAVGLIQGTASSSHGTLEADNARTFDISGKSVFDTPIIAGYNVKNNIQGAIFSSAAKQSSVTFNVAYDGTYERPLTPPTVAGSYKGSAASTKGGESATFVIGQDGSVKGVGLSGCTFSGTAAPHGNKNVLDASITFGPSPCLYPGVKASGIVYFSNKELIATMTLPDRSDAVIVVGSQ